MATAQLAVGGLYSLGVWAAGLRAGPADLGAAVKAALPIAAAHGAGQAATVVSLGAGAVSSTPLGIVGGVAARSLYTSFGGKHILQHPQRTQMQDMIDVMMTGGAQYRMSTNR